LSKNDNKIYIEEQDLSPGSPSPNKECSGESKNKGDKESSQGKSPKELERILSERVTCKPVSSRERTKTVNKSVQNTNYQLLSKKCKELEYALNVEMISSE
jgi:hypothetical protein